MSNLSEERADMASADIDFYSDDPVEDSHTPVKRNSSTFLAFLLLLVGGTYLVQTTLAANVSLNTGSFVEFGQGITTTTACSGATDLTITSSSSFTNSSGTGAFHLSSVTVSNVPISCHGVDFVINAYDGTNSTPLALFNSTSTDVVVYDNAGTFELGAGMESGVNIASGSGTFTATFTTPASLSSNVFKLTIQSRPHVPASTPIYEIGQVGPGGGFVYYVDDDGFDCGSSFTSTGSPTGQKCHYLEVAPSDWNTGTDPQKAWAVTPHDSADVSGVTSDAVAYNNGFGVGLGYKNSIAIVAQNDIYDESTNNYAAGAARAYAGGSRRDWYLPTTAELNLLCQWAGGIPPSVTNVCSGGTINSATYGASTAGFVSGIYWSSSARSASSAYDQFFSAGQQRNRNKNYYFNYVRPVRSF
jgi:hypothetical protein